jgi:hypothetical protein
MFFHSFSSPVHTEQCPIHVIPKVDHQFPGTHVPVRDNTTVHVTVIPYYRFCRKPSAPFLCCVGIVVTNHPFLVLIMKGQRIMPVATPNLDHDYRALSLKAFQ